MGFVGLYGPGQVYNLGSDIDWRIIVVLEYPNMYSSGNE